MFDLTFDSSALDKMPVGTSFRDADHKVSKHSEGWKCDDCHKSVVGGSSSAFMSDPSGKYALDTFAGALIDPDDLDPRLIAFLPAGTQVADRDTQSETGWHWYKTKSGRWVWAYSEKGAVASADEGAGIDDLSDYDYVRPFRLASVGTDEPEETSEGKTVFSAAEATNFKDCRFRDRDGDVWLFDEEAQRWRFIHFDGTLSVLSQHERLNSAMEPFTLVEGEPETETEPEPETEAAAQELSAEQADEKRDFVLSDTDYDRWTYSDGKWRCEGYENLSCNHLSDLHEPYEIVEPLAPEPAPAEKTKFSASEATRNKDTVFEDCDGDAWVFDYGIQRWRAIGPDWAYAKEELEAMFGPYTRVGPLSEHERLWTAEEANDLKDEALEDRDGDLWVFDVPSEQWKCRSAAISNSDLDAYYQPFRINKTEQARAAAESASDAAAKAASEAASTEEVTFEGSAKEAVELLDRIARSLESIDRKLGDK